MAQQPVRIVQTDTSAQIYSKISSLAHQELSVLQDLILDEQFALSVISQVPLGQQVAHNAQLDLTVQMQTSQQYLAHLELTHLQDQLFAKDVLMDIYAKQERQHQLRQERLDRMDLSVIQQDNS